MKQYLGYMGSLLLLSCCLLTPLQTLAQGKAQAPPTSQTQPQASQPSQTQVPIQAGQGTQQTQALTPAQQAQLQKAQAAAIAQMQADAKKFTVARMKTELEKSPNPVLYAKQILQKKFKIDTIIVSRTRAFNSLADSLAYNGRERKVYGPFESQNGQHGRFLVQVLTKAPNQFYHVGQIFIDTAVFSYKRADSLGNVIIAGLKDSIATFASMAQAYSMGGESATQGDLGWIARGVLLPQIEHEVARKKKGEVFRIWSSRGLHIIRILDDPKQDTGFALMMRVFL